MSSKLILFVTGATGYIGGHFLSHLLAHDPSALTKYEIRALVRSAEKAKSLSAIGLIPVLGSLDDADILIQESSHADVVLHFADADHVPAAKAILEGLLKQNGSAPTRKDKKPILIHTSGTGVLRDNAGGMFSTEILYHDDNLTEMLSLGPEKLHRDVELMVQDPKVTAKVDVVIVTPCTIWGVGSGPGNKNSIQIPIMAQIAVKFRQAYNIGKGLNIWNHIHVDDLAEGYHILLKASLDGKAKTGVEGYYFAENGEFAYGEVAKEIAVGLKQVGLNESGTVQDVVTAEEEKRIWPDWVNGSNGGNSRSRAVNLRLLGWKPTHGKEEMLEYSRQEVHRIVKEQK